MTKDRPMWTGTQIVVLVILMVITNLVTASIVYTSITSQNKVPEGYEGPDIITQDPPILPEDDPVIPPYNPLADLRYLKTTAVVQYDFINNTIALVEFTHYRLAKNGWELNLSLENMVTGWKCGLYGTELRSCQFKIHGDRGVEMFINYSYNGGDVYYGTVMFRPQDIDGGYSVGAGYSIRYDTGPVGQVQFIFEDSDPYFPHDPDHVTGVAIGRVPTEEFPAVWGQ